MKTKKKGSKKQTPVKFKPLPVVLWEGPGRDITGEEVPGCRTRIVQEAEFTYVESSNNNDLLGNPIWATIEDGADFCALAFEIVRLKNALAESDPGDWAD